MTIRSIRRALARSLRRFRPFALAIPLLALACGEAPEAAEPSSAADIPGEQVQAQGAPARARETVNPRLLRRFRRVASETESVPQPTEDVVTLGRMLWFEPRMSNDGKISCNSCHNLAAYGVDGLKTSRGDKGQLGRRNAPTVFNLAEHFPLFWDGRAHDPAAQAPMPIENPVEMASTRARVESFLRSVPEYRERFAKAFPDSDEPVTLEHVGESLAGFEQGLQTRSRFDDYLAGDESALSDDEVRGLRIFLDVGCMTCHTGPQVGANSFQKAGAVEAWPNQSDLGRYEITKDPADKMMFKVPTLKNISRTGPYFHDGSSPSLEDAVRRMGRHQLGIALEQDEVEALVHFLESLTGELPKDYIKPPPLPGLDAKRG